jgi:hypothetical protein
MLCMLCTTCMLRGARSYRPCPFAALHWMHLNWLHRHAHLSTICLLHTRLLSRKDSCTVHTTHLCAQLVAGGAELVASPAASRPGSAMPGVRPSTAARKLAQGLGEGWAGSARQKHLWVIQQTKVLWRMPGRCDRNSSR